MMSEKTLRDVFYTVIACICGFLFLFAVRLDRSSYEAVREDQVAKREITTPGTEAYVVVGSIQVENQNEKLSENNENSFTRQSNGAFPLGPNDRSGLEVDNQVKGMSIVGENLIGDLRKEQDSITDLEAISRTDGLRGRPGHSRSLESKSKFRPTLVPIQADHAATNVDAKDDMPLSLASEISDARFWTTRNLSNIDTQSNTILPNIKTESLNGVKPLELPTVTDNPPALDQRFVNKVPMITEPEARFALQGVGIDPLSEMVWIAAINDPSLPSNVRSNLIEDLNEEGFSDHRNITVDDLPLIVNRMILIEDLLFEAMDEVNADAFLEAYKDLENMYDRLVF